MFKTGITHNADDSLNSLRQRRVKNSDRNTQSHLTHHLIAICQVNVNQPVATQFMSLTGASLNAAHHKWQRSILDIWKGLSNK